MKHVISKKRLPALFFSFLALLISYTQPLQGTAFFSKLSSLYKVTDEQVAELRAASHEKEKTFEEIGTSNSRLFITFLIKNKFFSSFNEALLNDSRIGEEDLPESKLAVLNEIFEEIFQDFITRWARELYEKQLKISLIMMGSGVAPFFINLIFVRNSYSWKDMDDALKDDVKQRANEHYKNDEYKSKFGFLVPGIIDALTSLGSSFLPTFTHDFAKGALNFVRPLIKLTAFFGVKLIGPDDERVEHELREYQTDYTGCERGCFSDQYSGHQYYHYQNSFNAEKKIASVFYRMGNNREWGSDSAIQRQFKGHNQEKNLGYNLTPHNREVLDGLEGQVQSVIFKNALRTTLNILGAAGTIFVSLPGFAMYQAAQQEYGPFIEGSRGFNIKNFDLLKNYATKRPFMPEAQQNSVDEMFYQHLAHYGESLFWIAPVDDGTLKLRKFLEVALRMPLVRKKLSYDDAKTMDLFYFYPADTKETMAQFVFTQVRNQKILANEPDFEDARFPLYLVGKPGTGKSHAADLIAKALGVPVAKVNMDGAKIDDIVGLGFDTNDAKPGRLLEAITASVANLENIGISNQILLIDEFDRLLVSEDPASKACLSFMLKLLDPDIRGFYSPFLKSWVKLPDTIILAGNFDLSKYEEEEHEAIQSRIEVVKFRGFETEAKKEMVWNKFVPEAEAKFYNIKNERFRYEGLLKEDKDRINHFIENDKDPGLRSLLKFVQNTIEQSHMMQYLGDKP